VLQAGPFNPAHMVRYSSSISRESFAILVLLREVFVEIVLMTYASLE
jgi:hypothetical protein